LQRSLLVFVEWVLYDWYGNRLHMGLTYITAEVSNPARPKKTRKVRFLIDSGEAYSVVPSEVLEALGVRPHREKTFVLANGQEIKRKMGDAVFKYNGERASSPVIFGEKGDSNLLGVVTLEALGYIFDPIKRELRPLPMVLG
jgi:clan AA aspartic protease